MPTLKDRLLASMKGQNIGGQWLDDIKANVQAIPAQGLVGAPDAEGWLKNALAAGAGAANEPLAWLDEAATQTAGQGAEMLGESGVNPYVSAAAMLPMAIAPDLAMGPGGEAENLAAKGGRKIFPAAFESTGAMAKRPLKEFAEKLDREAYFLAKEHPYDSVRNMGRIRDLNANQDVPGLKEALLGPNGKETGDAAMMAWSDNRPKAKPGVFSGDYLTISPSVIRGLADSTVSMAGATTEGVLGHELEHAMRWAAGRPSEEIENATAHALSPQEARADRYADKISGGGLPRYRDKLEEIRSLFKYTAEKPADHMAQMPQKDVAMQLQSLLDRAKALQNSGEYKQTAGTIKKKFGDISPNLRYGIPLIAGAAAANSSNP